MNPQKPTSLNNDQICTWIISSVHVNGKTQAFELTMREEPRGLVVGAPFTVAGKLKESTTHAMKDYSVLRVAGAGIDIIPFLSILKAIRGGARRETGCC